VDPWQCTSEKGEESSGRKASCPDSGSRQRRVWQKSRQPVKPIRRKRESQIPIRQRSSTSHRHANEMLSVVAVRVCKSSQNWAPE